jgi:hypothetical protein
LVLLALAASSALAGQDLAVSTPADLLAADPRRIADLLDAARPAPVAQAVRTRVLAGLPSAGEVTDLGPEEWRRLAALGPLLRATGREGVYSVKVIDVPQAAVAIHARVVVLVSRTALALLDAEELQALVAHEVGHEYVWTAYERAVASSDHARLQDLELLCDGIAAVTLRRLGLDPARLTSGLKKLGTFNQRRFAGALRNRTHYPTDKRRREFVLAVTEWMGGTTPVVWRGGTRR